MITRTNIYIDGNNLYRSAKMLGFEINYKKFRSWLRQKFNPNFVYLFIGMIPERALFYKYLEDCGFILIFKETLSVEGVIKGNCDAEIVLHTISDFYTQKCNSFILITGDGDFGCVVKFLKENGVLHSVIAPNEEKCSILIKRKNISIIFLNCHYRKFSN